MQRVIMKSKIHRATVTRADPVFEGSCGGESRDVAPTMVCAGAQNRVREQVAIA
jgi:hypothetical protein